MESLLILISFLAPVITGITQLLKGYVPEKYYALIPVILGLILGVLSFPVLPVIGAGSLSLGVVIWAGLLSGLTASGVYSFANISKKGNSQDEK